MSKFLKIVSVKEKYGEGELGVVAQQDFNAGDVILYEIPLVYVAAAICVDDKEKLKEHKKLFAPKGTYLAWVTEDLQHHLGGQSSYLVQVTIRMIKHQEIKSRAIVEQKCQEYRRLHKPARVTPPPTAYLSLIHI